MGIGRDNYDSRVNDNLVTIEQWPDRDEESHVPGDLKRNPAAEAGLMCLQSVQRGGHGWDRQSKGREKMSWTEGRAGADDRQLYKSPRTLPWLLLQ